MKFTHHDVQKEEYPFQTDKENYTVSDLQQTLITQSLIFTSDQGLEVETKP